MTVERTDMFGNILVLGDIIAFVRKAGSYGQKSKMALGRIHRLTPRGVAVMELVKEPLGRWENTNQPPYRHFVETEHRWIMEDRAGIKMEKCIKMTHHNIPPDLFIMLDSLEITGKKL